MLLLLGLAATIYVGAKLIELTFLIMGDVLKIAWHIIVLVLALILATLQTFLVLDAEIDVWLNRFDPRIVLHCILILFAACLLLWLW